jgi:hypothetical protein
MLGLSLVWEFALVRIRSRRVTLYQEAFDLNIKFPHAGSPFSKRRLQLNGTSEISFSGPVFSGLPNSFGDAKFSRAAYMAYMGSGSDSEPSPHISVVNA